MSDDLASWLRRQLDEDERLAAAVPRDLGAPWTAPGPWIISGQGGPEAEVARVVDHIPMPIAEAVADHIARHNPARVQREIDAKRRIIDEHGPDEWGNDCRRCCDYLSPHAERAKLPYPCATLRLLALPYADRPGYREEDWKP